MVGQTEQHLAGLEGLAIDGIALGDDAVLRGGPDDRVGDAAGSLDLLDDLGRNLQVLQAAAGTDHARREDHARAVAARPRPVPVLSSR